MIPWISRSFVAKATLVVTLGIIASIGPIGWYLMRVAASKSYQDAETKLGAVATGLSLPLANLLLLENELELELTVAQLARNTFFTWVGVADKNNIWTTHSQSDQRGGVVEAKLQTATDGLRRSGSSYFYKQPLTFSDQTVGSLYLGVPSSLIEDPIRRERWLVAFIASGTALIAIVSLTIILIVLLKPIPDIRAFARKIAAGEWGATLNTKRVDEVGQLIDSLNEMSKELHLAQKSRMEKELLEKEISLAAEIQLALIPEAIEAPTFLRIASHFEPAKSVGGDFYYCASGGKGAYYAIVADVSGKGVGSALLGSQIQGMFASLLQFSPVPDAAFRHINRVIREHSSTDLYCTAAAVAIWMDGRAAVVNAGHPGVRLVRRNGVLEVLEGNAPALCLFEPEEFADQLYSTEVRLAAGDKLVLFSDGLTESFNSAGQPYGEERLDTECKRGAAESAPELFERILRSVQEFSQTIPHADDITLVVIEML